MKKSPPQSALDSLADEPGQSADDSGAVAILDAPPADRKPAYVVHPDEIGSDLDDCIQRYIDSEQTLEDVRQLAEAGFSGLKLQLEVSRISRLNQVSQVAMLPEELETAQAELEAVRKQSLPAIAKLEEELADVTRRIHSAIATEREKITSRERRLHEAEVATKAIRDNAPKCVLSLCGHFEQLHCNGFAKRVSTLRHAVDIRERGLKLTAEDHELLWTIRFNKENPLRIPELQECHISDRHSVMERAIPSVKARCEAELPALREQLQAAQADLARSSKVARSPMEAHVRHWIGKARKSRKPPQS